jgi:hypothetical protein
MVDLPRVPRRFATTSAPQTSITRQDVSLPWDIASRVFSIGAETLLTKAEETERASRAAELARRGAGARTAGLAMAQEFQGDAEGFAAGWDAFTQQQLRASGLTGPDADMFAADLASVGGQYQRSLMEDSFQRTNATALQSVQAQRAALGDELTALAYAGRADSAEFNQKAAMRRRLGEEMSGNPAFNISGEATRLEDEQFEAFLVGENVRGTIERLYDDDPAAAKAYAEEVIGDLNLSAEEKRKLIADSLSIFSGRAAEMRALRAEFREDVKPVLEAIEKGTPYSIDEANALIARAEELQIIGMPQRIRQAIRDRGRIEEIEAMDREGMLGAVASDFAAASGLSPSTAFLNERTQDRESISTAGQLDPVFADNLARALADAEAATGQKAVIREHVRSSARQAQYYANYTRQPVTWQGVTYQPQGTGGGLAAAPGRSRHQRGQSADIEPGPVLDWLHANAGHYGLEFLEGDAFKADPVHIQLARSAGGGFPRVQVPAEFAPAFDTATSTYGLPPGLLAAMAQQESGFAADVISGARRSSAGATGLMQFMPGTAAQFGIDPTNPQQSIDAAGKYMRQLLDRYGGNVSHALAAYNWGPGNVDKWLAAGGDPAKLPKETRDYVANITGMARGGATAPAGGPISPAGLARERGLLTAELNEMLSEAEFILGKGIGLDMDSAGLMVNYARAIDDSDLTQKVDRLIQEAMAVDLQDRMSPQEAEALRATLRSDMRGDRYMQARVLDQLESRAARQDKLREESPNLLGVEKGLYEFAPIDMSSAEGISRGLATRSRQNAVLSALEGRAYDNLLLPQEALALGEAWRTADVAGRLGILDGIAASGVKPDQVRASIAALAGDEGTHALAAAAVLQSVNPAAAKGIVRGQWLVTQDPKRAPKPEDWVEQTEIAFPPTLVTPDREDARQGLLSAVRYRYIDMAYRAGFAPGEVDPELVDKAVRDVTGGTVYFNGRHLMIAPVYGMEQDAYDDLEAALTDADFAGAVMPDGTPITMDEIRNAQPAINVHLENIGATAWDSDVRLVAVGDGRYVLQFGSDNAPTFAMQGEGRPFVLDFRKVIARQARAAADAPAVEPPAPLGTPPQDVPFGQDPLITGRAYGGEEAPEPPMREGEFDIRFQPSPWEDEPPTDPMQRMP